MTTSPVMQLVDWVTLVDRDFTLKDEFQIVEEHVKRAIDAVVWPPGTEQFTIHPSTGRGRGEGNGVKPIKDAFITSLLRDGWEAEVRRFDALYRYPASSSLPFVVEWETGNISSSHRAINRIAIGMLKGEVCGGILVLPSGPMYRFLTDRVGNAPELAPYFDLWRKWQELPEFTYLAVAVVEHDNVSYHVPRIEKGTDGRALL